MLYLPTSNFLIAHYLLQLIREINNYFPLLQQLWFELLQQELTKTGTATGLATGTGITKTGWGLCPQHGWGHLGLHGAIPITPIPPPHDDPPPQEHPPQCPPNWAGSTSTGTMARSSSANANWTRSKATKMTKENKNLASSKNK